MFMDMPVFSMDNFTPESYYEHDGIRVEIEKVGGGTIGRKYIGNWFYRVIVHGVWTTSGSDYVTNTAKSHHQVAFDLWEYFTRE